jgi:hypothetical protein
LSAWLRRPIFHLPFNLRFTVFLSHLYAFNQAPARLSWIPK